MLKTAAIIFGIILLAVGALGFVPQAKVGNLLLGIFHVNFIHNLFHIITGIIAILSGLRSNYASRIYFQIFGVIYAVLAILGFYYMDRHILGYIANNMADNILHILIAIVTLYLGFFVDLPATPLDRDRDFK